MRTWLTSRLLLTLSSLAICQGFVGEDTTFAALGAPASPELVAELNELLDADTKVACCGFWSSASATKLQRHVAKMLELRQSRHVSDVHLENASVGVQATGSSVHWGAVMVLILNSPADAEIHLRGPEGHQSLEVGQGMLLFVPEGSALVSSRPLRLAWVRVRKLGSPPRSFFEFYIASWIQKHFVAPYDTVPQRRFFRAHVKHPRYWHGFLWSFIGMFSTIFACMPIVWWSIQIMVSLQSVKDPEVLDAERGVAAETPRTLLPKVGEGRTQSLNFPGMDKLEKDVPDFVFAYPRGCRV